MDQPHVIYYPKKKKQSTAKDDNKQWEIKLTCVGPFNAPFPQEVATQESCRLNTLLCFTFLFYLLLCSDRECNPSLLSIFQQIAAPTLTPPQIENRTSVVIIGTEEPVLDSPYLQWWDAQSIVGLALFVLCILYSR